MDRKHEEAQAEVLWSFIQQLRERDDELVRGLDGLSPEAAAELAALLQTARDVSVALQLESRPSESAAARVREAVAARAAQPPKRSRKTRRVASALRLGRQALACGRAGRGPDRRGGARREGCPARMPLEAIPQSGIAALSHEAARRDLPLLAGGKLCTCRNARRVLAPGSLRRVLPSVPKRMMGRTSRGSDFELRQLTWASKPVTVPVAPGRTD